MNYVVEFEGYAFSSKFIFKEVCIFNVNTEEINNLFLRSPYPRKCLSAKEKRIVNFCESNLHKIKWYSGYQKYKDFKHSLSQIGLRDKVYTKGVQKVEILQRILNPNVEVINLEDIGCENISVYMHDLNLNHCIFADHKDSDHCAYLKAQAFKIFLCNHESPFGTKY